MNTLAQQEPHQVSEVGGGRGRYFAEEASLPSRLQTYFGLPRVRNTSCPSKVVHCNIQIQQLVLHI